MFKTRTNSCRLTVAAAGCCLILVGSGCGGGDDAEESQSSTSSASVSTSTTVGSEPTSTPPTVDPAAWEERGDADDRRIEFEPPVQVDTAIKWAQDSGFTIVVLDSEVRSGDVDFEDVYLFTRVRLIDDDNGMVGAASVG